MIRESNIWKKKTEYLLQDSNTQNYKYLENNIRFTVGYIFHYFIPVLFSFQFIYINLPHFASLFIINDMLVYNMVIKYNINFYFKRSILFQKHSVLFSIVVSFIALSIRFRHWICHEFVFPGHCWLVQFQFDAA